MWHICSYWKETKQREVSGQTPSAFLSVSLLFSLGNGAAVSLGLLICCESEPQAPPRARQTLTDAERQSAATHGAPERSTEKIFLSYLETKKLTKGKKRKVSSLESFPSRLQSHLATSKATFSPCPWLITWLCNYEVQGLSDNFVMNSSRLAPGCDSAAETSQ